MESNLLLEQYSWYKKQQLAKAPFECLLNADIEPNPHQVNAFCAAIQALKTGGIILADEVGLGKTIEAGLVLNYVLDNGAKKVLISLPATLRKQWEVELLEKFGRQAVILDRYTVEHDLANVQTHLGNADEVSIVIASYDYSSKLIKRFPHVKWDFLIIDEAHNLRNVFHGTKRAKNLYDLTHGIPKILLTATPLQNSLTDLHGLVSFIDPRIFGSEKVFNRRFVDGCDYEELKQELLPVLYRTLRRDVGKYMAFSKRTCITVDFHLSTEEKELYDSMGFRQFIFYLAHKVDFIAEIFLCTMILFGNVGAQPAASFLLKFASFAKFLKQPESLCCFCTNQIFNFFSCNTAVFQCILKNE